MKYSIFQYSQEKLLEYSLDVIDALILSWFSDFFVGSMEKKIFKDSKNNNKLFGWVKLSKVMEDLPCLGINTEKGLKRRFDLFIEKGIMERNTVITQNGKKTYYRPTDVYETLINTKAEQNKNTEEQNRENISHDYSSSLAENQNPHRTKTTYAKQKNSENISHNYSSSLAERNFGSHAHTNQNSHALNNTSTSNSLTTDAALIASCVEKTFGKNYFDADFPGKAADFLKNKNKLDNADFQNYTDYVFDKVQEKVKNKKVNDPRAFSYRLFFQVDILQEYLESKETIKLQHQKAAEQEAKKITCPVCNERFLPNSYITECPKCSFSTEKFGIEKEVRRYKKYMQLSEDSREEYNHDLFSFKSEMSAVEKLRYMNTQEGKEKYNEYVQSIDEKYGLTG